MKRIDHAFFMLFLTLALQPFPLSPAEENVSLLTIEQAVAKAKMGNAKILQARALIEAAEGQHLLAKVFPEPEIVVEFGEMPSLLRPDRADERKIGLAQRMEWPGKRKWDLRVSRQRLEIRRIELQCLELKVSAAIKKNCLNLLFLEKKATELTRLKELLSQFEEMAAARYRVQATTYLDLLRSRMEKSRAESDLEECRSRMDSARAKLSALMGMEKNQALGLRDEWVFQSFAASLEEVMGEKLSNHPDLRLASLEKQAGEATVRRALASSGPDLSLGLFYQRLGGKSPYNANDFSGTTISSWSMEIGLSLPLLWGSRRSGEFREAMGRRLASEIRGETIKKEIVRAVEAAYRRLKTVERRVIRQNDSSLPDAHDALESGLSQYRSGKLDAMSLLDLIRTLYASQLEHQHSLLQFRLALVDLETTEPARDILEEENEEEE